MRNLAFAVLVGILLVSGLLAACQGVVLGSGDPETRTFDYTDFTRIEAHNGFHVEITRSSSYSIEVITDDNVWKYLDVSKNGDTLVIEFEWNRSYTNVIKEAVITIPDVEGIQLSGGSRGDIDGFNSSNDFSIQQPMADQFWILSEECCSQPSKMKSFFLLLGPDYHLTKLE